MVREAKVVVRAEADSRAPVDDDVWTLLAGDRAWGSHEAVGLERIEPQLDVLEKVQGVPNSA